MQWPAAIVRPVQRRFTVETIDYNLKGETLSGIAALIRSDWRAPYFGAVPYLSALGTLRDIGDAYGADTARDVVLYFLSNATTWRGPTARAVKAELKRRLSLK